MICLCVYSSFSVDNTLGPSSHAVPDVVIANAATPSVEDDTYMAGSVVRRQEKGRLQALKNDPTKVGIARVPCLHPDTAAILLLWTSRWWSLLILG